MSNMLEKKFKNEELGFEITSYIDKQQNIWFRGKDVADILGYSKPRNAIERHVSNNHKMLQLYWGPETGHQQNDNRGRETRPQQKDSRGGLKYQRTQNGHGGTINVSHNYHF